MNIRNSLIIFWLLVFSIVGCSTANAASVYFDVEETTIGNTGPFTLKVFLDSAVPVNAVTLVLDLPESVSLVDYSDGNSIINLWVEKPTLRNGQIVLSGVIPGGFQGEDAKLVELDLEARQIGNVAIGVSADSVAYQNNENATAEKVTGKSLILTVVADKENIKVSPEDNVPPESFVPKFVDLTEGDSENWAVAFITQDKGSGVDYYEVAESDDEIDVTEDGKLDLLDWSKAETPYLLTDQERRSYVYVRAVDNKGNERLAVISPQSVWSPKVIGYIIIIAILLGLYAIVSRKNKKIVR